MNVEGVAMSLPPLQRTGLVAFRRRGPCRELIMSEIWGTRQPVAGSAGALTRPALSADANQNVNLNINGLLNEKAYAN
jgi:hypothetical protein